MHYGWTTYFLCFWVVVLAPIAGAANVAAAVLVRRPPLLLPYLVSCGVVFLLAVPLFGAALAFTDVGPYLVRVGMLAGLVGAAVDLPLAWYRNVRDGRVLGRLLAESSVVGFLTVTLLYGWNASSHTDH